MNKSFKKTIAAVTSAALLSAGAVVSASAIVAVSPDAAHVVSLVATTPASNATSVTLLGSPLTLKTSVGASTYNNAATSHIVYAVSNASATTVSAKFSTGANALEDVNFAAGADNQTPAATTSSATSFTVRPTRTVDAGVAPAHDYQYTSLDDVTKVNNLQLNVSSAATVSLNVYAFVDINANGTYDADTEYASATQTLTFVKASEVTAVPTLTAPVLSATELKATVDLGSNINPSQLTAGAVQVQFIKNGVALGAPVNATWDAVDGLHATAAETVVPAVYGVQVLVSGVNSGSPVYSTVTAGTVATIAAPVAVVNANTRAGLVGEATYVVRSSTTASASTATLASKLYTNVPALVGSGVAAKVTVTKVALDAATTITVGGKTLTSTTVGNAVTFDTTTDANGEVLIALSSNTSKATDKVSIVVTSAGASSLISSAATTVEWKATSAAAPVDLGLNGGVERSILKGGAVSIQYGVTDAFGAALATSDYRVLATLTNNSTGATLTAQSVVVVAGKATVAFTDNSSSLGVYTVNTDLQKLNSVTGNYETLGLATQSKVNVVATVTPTVVTLNANNTTGLAIEAKDFVALDRRLDKTVAAPAYTTVTTLSGRVTNSTGAGVIGGAVTLSGKGLAFSYGDVYTVDSITINADNTGDFTGVKVYSHASGAITVTATAGAATATKVLTWANTNVAAKIAVTAAKRLQVGSGMSVVVTITDKWGNPVVDSASNLVNIVLEGEGSLNSASNFYGTDSKGQIALRLTAGVNDFGTSKITVSVPTVTTLTAVVADVNIGETTVSAKKTSKGFTVSANYAKGKKVVVKRNNVTVKTATVSSNDLTAYALKSVKGKNVVTVYVNGKKVSTLSFKK